MKHYTAYQLHVVVYHVPHHVVSTCHPVILIDGFVAFDGYKVFSLGGEVSVHLRCGHFHCLIGSETRCGFSHRRKYSGKHLVKLILIDFKDVFLSLVDIVP